MDALPARTAGSFFERPVAPFLRDVFACLWVHRMPAAASPIIVTPDATIDLQWIDGKLRIAGPDKDPQIEVLPAGATVVGLRFHPAAAAGWLGVPAADLLERRLPLEDLWGTRARRLASQVREFERLADLIGSLERAVERCAAERPPADARMRAAYDLVQARPPPEAPLVPWLGRALDMSERTLRRRFDACFGYGPKTLDRILRYQSFLRLARGSGHSTAILAVEAGYSDQAHLVRESRRLTGNTPLQIEHLMKGAANLPASSPNKPLT
ncbi:MAG: helix-turn-helix transcriptional regulator [Methylobacteriaceae bacterium]|nr:helix-turn-helix transcriptional regulator [Methylobacteriaceae bacterium]